MLSKTGGVGFLGESRETKLMSNQSNMILSHWYASTPKEDVILVLNTSTSPFEDCRKNELQGILPGKTGYQVRAVVQRYDFLKPVTDQPKHPTVQASVKEDKAVEEVIEEVAPTKSLPPLLARTSDSNSEPLEKSSKPASKESTVKDSVANIQTTITKTAKASNRKNKK